MRKRLLHHRNRFYLALPIHLRRSACAWPSAVGTALLAEKTGRVLFEFGPVLFTEDSVNAGLAIGLAAQATETRRAETPQARNEPRRLGSRSE